MRSHSSTTSTKADEFRRIEVITSGTIGKDAYEAAATYTEEKGIPIELMDGEQFATLIVEHGIRRAQL